jgi:uncharacterized membrane protein YciS (DUF1049 family)
MQTQDDKGVCIMPWRLIVFIIVFAIFLVFITLNLENKSDISFGFTVIRDVPIFLAIFFSFAFGFICTLPLILFSRKKRKDAACKDMKFREKIPEIMDEPSVQKCTSNLPDGGHHGVE